MEKAQVFSILPLVQPTPDGSLVDKIQIARICAHGLSECPPEDRAIAWLVLLGVFPQRPEDWKEVQEQRKTLYMMFMEEYGMSNWTEKVFPANTKKSDFDVQDKTTMSIIHGDIIRSGRVFYFLPPEEIPEGADPNSIQAPFTYHIRRLERILYIFAMTNPSLMYMQGFNELVIPMYYVMIIAKFMFYDDTILIESLVYAMLQNLLTNTDMQEFYSTQDQSQTIIKKLGIYEKVLNSILPNVYTTLKNLNISPVLYAYRWFNILFAQEHDLPVLLIIWDSLFAHINNLVEYSYYVAVAHVESISKNIIPDNFPKTVECLQNLKITNPLAIIYNADIMWTNRDKKKKKK